MKKIVLIAVVGKSPAVVTEAIYALINNGVVTKSGQIDIQLITTGKCEKRIKDDQNPANTLETWINKLYVQSFGKNGENKPVEFIENENLHILTRKGTDNQPEKIDDLVDIESNLILIDKCCELASKYSTGTDRQDVPVYYLIAGGRKTMATSIMCAAQIYARTIDRVFHVLANPSDVEDCIDFWYPSSRDSYKSIDGKTIYDRSEIEITLINQPFIPLRIFYESKIKNITKNLQKNYLDIISSFSTDENSRLKIICVKKSENTNKKHLKSNKITYSENSTVELNLPDSTFSLYLYLVLRKLDREICSSATCSGCVEKKCFIEFNSINEEKVFGLKYADIIQIIKNGYIDNNARPGEYGTPQREYITHINNGQKLKKGEYYGIINTFGNIISDQIKISSFKINKKTVFGINIDKSRIDIDVHGIFLEK